MSIKINQNTCIEGFCSPAVHKAADALRRDMEKVIKKDRTEGASICLIEDDLAKEQFIIMVSRGRLEIHAGDDLGFIYGIYEVSRSILGVSPFWFWNDQEFVPVDEIRVDDTYCFRSKPCAVAYRGWFINDEVLIHTWCVERKKDKPWEMVFEALLRCGGNMVIPGTDRNANRYRELASGMGLYITHHHAEPLGAEMFARAYPDLNPSYAEYPDQFQGLWRDAIERQKGLRVIWNLGFRGQGDCPFWLNDPQYETDEARGGLLGSLIRLQYDMVRESDSNAVCCVNLYGEMMELYQKGCLELPEDVTKIRADNGYGKMVSRRQNNHNPRIPSLPEAGNKERNGIYYHVSFYDLQAANHITMLPNSPAFVARELAEVLERNGGYFWMVNCSNVKPHVYFLDLIARIWRDGAADTKQHLLDYAEEYYGSENRDRVASCLSEFADCAPVYGAHEDDHAGEQFANHVPRMFVSQYLRNGGGTARCEDMDWAAGGDSLKEQLLWYEAICEKTSLRYAQYFTRCKKVSLGLTGPGRRLFEDTVLLQAEILFHCYQGALLTAKSLLCGLRGEYKQSFYLAGKGRKEYLEADASMRGREHGKWHNFFANECLTDVKQSAWVLEGLMSFVRNQGDGPHFYRWQREFLYPEEDRRVLLVLNMDNHLRNEELFTWMEEKWD